MIAIFDYGSGNLRSAERAFALASNQVVVTRDVEVALSAQGLVIPGVGAYAACMTQLNAAGGDRLIRERVAAGKKVLGICVGMQIFFQSGVEKETVAGVGALPGVIEPLRNPVLPHIGWNNVDAAEGSTLFDGINGEQFYFVHSYAAHNPVPDALNSYATYGERFVAAVETPIISATQFHPEKSGEVGARLIKNWIDSL